MNIQNEVIKYKEEAIASLRESIKIKSVEEKPLEGMPFGEGPAKALQHILEIGTSLGFETKNYDNYVGEIILGEGDETLGILGHIDVVPEGDGWDFPPYSGEISDNILYGRGTLDNKGPLFICLYAMKCLKDLNIPLSKQVKMIVGANEETGWGCMTHYFDTLKMPEPTLSFTPDSSFPVTFAEKGILHGLLKVKTSDDYFISGGNAFNSVPEKATITLPNSYKEKIKESVAPYKDFNDYSIEVVENENNFTLISHGKSAHASTPYKGYNSLSALMSFLYTNNIQIEGLSNIVNLFGEKIKLEYNGKSAGLFFEDEESGEITINYSKAYIEDGNLYISLDIRYPVTTEEKQVKDAIASLISEYNLEFIQTSASKALYVPKDSLLVKELTSIYEEITGDKESEPVAIGGGTYARAVSNCVAFGALLKGTVDNMHQKNECIDLSTIDTLLKIYIEAIYRLAK